MRRNVNADGATKAGLVAVRQERLDRDPFASASLDAAPVDAGRRLTLEQDAALARLVALSRAGTFKTALLHGVGGGNTPPSPVGRFLANNDSLLGRRCLLFGDSLRRVVGIQQRKFGTARHRKCRFEHRRLMNLGPEDVVIQG